MSKKYTKFPDELDRITVDNYVGKDYVGALSGTGVVLVIGAKYASSGTSKRKGGVGVYRSNGEKWILDTVFTDTNGHDGDQYGAVIAIDEVGDILTIAAPKAIINGNKEQGKVDVYKYDPVTKIWVETHSFSPTANIKKQRFGYAMGMSKTADIIVIGSYKTPSVTNNSEGAVHIYRLDINGLWVEEIIYPPITGEYKEFGKSLTLSADGNLLTLSVEKINPDDHDDKSDEILTYDLSATTLAKNIVIAKAAAAAALAAPVAATPADVQLAVTTAVQNVAVGVSSVATQAAAAAAATAVAQGATSAAVQAAVQVAVQSALVAVAAIVVFKVKPKAKFDTILNITPDGKVLTINTNAYTDMYPGRGKELTFINIAGTWHPTN